MALGSYKLDVKYSDGTILTWEFDITTKLKQANLMISVHTVPVSFTNQQFVLDSELKDLALAVGKKDTYMPNENGDYVFDGTNYIPYDSAVHANNQRYVLVPNSYVDANNTPYISYFDGENEIILNTESIIYNDSLYGQISDEQNIFAHVVMLRAFSFEGCSNIPSISIGTAVMYVEEGAFIDVSGLKELGVTNTHASLGVIKTFPTDPVYAYEGGLIFALNDDTGTAELISYLSSNTLKEYTVPDFVSFNDVVYTVNRIGAYAFAHIDALEKVTLGNNITSIGDYAFYGCNNIKWINVPRGELYGSDYYFEAIGDHAFDMPNLETVYFVSDINPDGLNYVYDNGLNKARLGNLIFGDNIEVKVYSAAQNGGLLDQYLTNYSLGSMSFSSVTAVENFSYELVNGNEIKIKVLLNTSITDVVIPAMIDGKPVTAIASQAFMGNTNLRMVTIPSTVNTIGSNAFYNCTGLRQVYVDGLVSTLGLDIFKGCNYDMLNVFGKPGGELDSYCSENSIAFNSGTYWGCFIVEYDAGEDGYYVTGLVEHFCNTSHKYLTIPTSVFDDKPVVGIAAGAFENQNVVSVTISTSTQIDEFTIGEKAFGGCSRLSDIYLFPGIYEGDDSETIINIHEHAFGDADKVPVGMTVHHSISDSNLKHIKNAVEGYSLTKVTMSGKFITEPVAGGLRIASYLDIDNPNPDKVVVIPDQINGTSVVEIGNLSFMNAGEMVTLVLGKHVTKIGDHAFESCISLKYIFLPDGLKEIGESAFSDCSSLLYVSLPSSVERIGDFAFNGCQALQELRFNGDVENIGAGILDNVSGAMEFVHIRSTATNLAKYLRTYYRLSIGQTSSTDYDRIPYIEQLSDAEKWQDCFTFDYNIEEDSLVITGLKDHSGCAGGDHKDIVIPATIGGVPVRYVGERAFAGYTSLRSVTFAEGSEIYEVGKYAFDGCVSLGVIDMKQVRLIHDYAFNNCLRLSQLYVGLMDETDISVEAFEGCNNLSNIIFDTSATQLVVRYYSTPGALYNEDYHLILCYSVGNEVFAPDLARGIDEGAFDSRNSAIKQLVLPATIGEIDFNDFVDLVNLEDIYLQDSIVIKHYDPSVTVNCPFGTTVSGCDNVTYYVPESGLNLDLRLSTTEVSQLYVKDGKTYVGAGNKFVLVDTLFAEESYTVFRKHGDNSVTYAYDNGEFKVINGFDEDMYSVDYKCFADINLTNVLDLREVTVVDDSVYFNKTRIESLSSADVYKRYVAIRVENGEEKGVEFIYVDRNNKVYNNQLAEQKAEEGETLDFYVLGTATLYRYNGNLFFIRESDSAMVKADGLTLLSEQGKNTELYYYNGRQFSEVKMINGVAYNNDLERVAGNLYNIFLAEYEEFGLREINYVYSVVPCAHKDGDMDGRCDVCTQIMGTADVVKYLLADNSTLMGNFNIYSLASGISCDIKGIIISSKDLTHSDWQDWASVKTEMVVPDYAYIHGVSYPVVEIKQGGFEYVSGSQFAFTSINLAGSNIVTVSANAFADNTTITEVSLGDNVTRLGANAFAGCSALKTVNVGSGLAHMDGNPFSGVAKDVTIAFSRNQSFRFDKVVAGLYDNCSFSMILSLDGSRLVALNAVPEDGNKAIISIPEGVSVIASGAFLSDNIEQIMFPVTLRKVEEKAFDFDGENNNLKKVVFSGYVKEIAENAFNVTAPDFTLYGLEPAGSVKESVAQDYATKYGIPFRAYIPSDAFVVEENSSGTGATIVKGVSDKIGETLIIPAEVWVEGSGMLPITNIAQSAFYGFKQIREIYFSNPHAYGDDDGGITEIGAYAFAGLSNLRNVVFMHSSLSSVIFGTASFAYATSLNEVYFENAPAGCYIPDMYVFKGSNDKAIIYLADGMDEWYSIGLAQQHVLSASRVVTEKLNDNQVKLVGFKNLTVSLSNLYGETVILPKYVGGAKVVNVSIDYNNSSYVNEMKKLESVAFPDSVTEIGAYSFGTDGTTGKNSSLKEVIISQNIDKIGDYAFTSVSDMSVYVELDYLGSQAYQIHCGATPFASDKKLTLYLPEECDIRDYYENSDNYSQDPADLEIIINTPVSAFEYTLKNGSEISILGLTAYGKTKENIVVPRFINGKRVTTLGDGAFANATSLKTLSLPENLTTMGHYVFVGTFTDTQPSAQEIIFRGQSSRVFQYLPTEKDGKWTKLLTDYTVGDPTTIYALMGSSTINTFTISKKITTIYEGAFSGIKTLNRLAVNTENKYFKAEGDIDDYCTRLYSKDGTKLYAVLANDNVDYEKLSFPNVTVVGAYAFCNFKDASVKTVEFSMKLVEMHEGAFAGAENLTNIDISKSALTEIASNTFRNCKSLSDIALPSKIRYIGKNAFFASGLTSVELPDLLFEISDGAFAGCEKITSVDLSNTDIIQIGKDAFADCTSLVDVVLGDAIVSIGEGAFSGTAIASIKLPASITEISARMFENTPNLKGVTLAEGAIITTIGDYAFRNASGLSELPDNIMITVNSIGKGAFMGSALQTVRFGNGLTYIPDECFKDCKYLTSVDLPSTIITIGISAFEGCNGIVDLPEGNFVKITSSATSISQSADFTESEDLVLTTQKGKYSYTVIDGYAIRLVAGRITINDKGYSGVDGVVTIGNLTLTLAEDKSYILVEGGSQINYSYGITDIQFGIKVTDIGDRAFANCALTSVYISDSIIRVGDYAFADNYNLESAEIGSNLRELGEGVFSKATKLSSIDVSSRNVTFTNLDNGVLYGYKTSITGERYLELKIYPAGLVPSGDERTYVLPEKAISIDANAFEYSKIMTIIIPDTVNYIGANAFAHADSLVSIFFDGDLAEENIVEDIFANTSPALVVDIPMNSNLEELCILKGIKYVTHTPKACFDYLEGEDNVTILGFSGNCDCDNHETLIIPTYINGKAVKVIKEFAFANAGVRHFTLGRYVENIGSGFLFGNAIETLSIAGIRNLDYDGVNGEEYTYNDFFKVVEVVENTEIDGEPIQTVVATYLVQDEELDTILVYAASSTLGEFTIPEDVGQLGYGAFYGVTNLHNVVFNGYVSEIPAYAFAESGLTGIDGTFFVPETIISVGEGAFEGISTIEAIHFGKGSEVFISAKAFANMDGLKSVAWVATDEEGNETVVDNNGVYGFTHGVLFMFETPVDDENVPTGEVGRAVLHTYTQSSDLRNYSKEIIIPERVVFNDLSYNVEQIENYAFYGVECVGGVKAVILPDTLMGVGEMAFVNTNFDSVHFENYVSYTSTIEKQIFDTRITVYLPYDESEEGTMHAHLEKMSETANAVAFRIVTNKKFLNYFINTVEGYAVVYGLSPEAPLDIAIPYYIEGKVVTQLGIQIGAEGELTVGDRAYTEDFVSYLAGEQGEGAITGSTFGAEDAINASQITSIKMYDDVISYLAPYLFQNCSALEKVTLTSSAIITRLPDGIFYGNSALEDVSFSTVVDEIGNFAFYQCTSLKEIPQIKTNAYRTIGDYAFYGCSAIKEIYLNPQLIEVGEYAFANCMGLTNLSVSVTGEGSTLGAGAFNGCTALSYVNFVGEIENLPGVVEDGGNYDFTNAITIFDGVPNFGGGVNENVLVRLPANARNLLDYLKQIGFIEGRNLFAYTPETCFTVYVKPDNSGVIITGLHQGECAYCNGDSNNIVIPDTIGGLPVVGIGEEAFKSRSNITAITLNSDLETIGRGAFDGLASLTTITVGIKNVSALKSIDDYAFRGTGLTSFTSPSVVLERIGVEAFANTPLQSISLASVNTIGDRAFAKYVAWSDGASIEDIANNDTLSSIVITFREFGGKLGTIGDYAFAKLTALTKLNTNSSQDKLREIGDYAFYGASGSASVSLGSVERVGDYAFAYSNLGDDIVPSTLVYVGKFAYAQATGLEEISLLSDGVIIEEGAFSGSSIQKFEFVDLAFVQKSVVVSYDNTNKKTPEVVSFNAYGQEVYGTKVGAFENCQSLQAFVSKSSGNYVVDQTMLISKAEKWIYGDDSTNATIIQAPLANTALTALDTKITSKYNIGDKAFENNTNIKTVRYSRALKFIGAMAFKNCTSLTDASANTTPSLAHIRDQAFYGCTALESATIYTNVSLVGDGAYQNSGLKSVSFAETPSTALHIGANAFNAAGLTGSTLLHRRVVSIGDNAFANLSAVQFAYNNLNGKSGEEVSISSTAFKASALIYYSSTHRNEGSKTLLDKDTVILHALSGYTNVYLVHNACFIMDLDNFTASTTHHNCAHHMEEHGSGGSYVFRIPLYVGGKYFEFNSTTALPTGWTFVNANERTIQVSSL